MLAIEVNGRHHVSMHFGQQVSLCYVDRALSTTAPHSSCQFDKLQPVESPQKS